MSANPSTHSTSLRRAMHRHGVAIKVNVEHDRSPRPPIKPPATVHHLPAAKRAEPTVPAPAASPRRPQRPTINDVPIQQRQRLMWGVVGVGMLVVIVGWALTFGANLRGAGGNNLFSDITKIFKDNPLTPKKATPQSVEIQRLEKQVFPQFQ